MESPEREELIQLVKRAAEFIGKPVNEMLRMRWEDIAQLQVQTAEKKRDVTRLGVAAERMTGFSAPAWIPSPFEKSTRLTTVSITKNELEQAVQLFVVHPESFAKGSSRAARLRKSP